MAYINALGYRGRSFVIPKPRDIRRVVVLGGSGAFDPHAVAGHVWPHLTERYLRHSGHRNVEVINAGVPGHATWDLLGRLYGDIWTIGPDYVVVYEAWNDIKYFGWLSPQRTLMREYRPPPVSQVNGSSLVSNPFIYYSGPFDRLLSHSQLYVRVRRRFWWWRLGQMGFEGLLTGPQDAAPQPDQFPDAYSSWGPKQYELNLRLIAAAARAIGATPIFLTQARLVDSTNGARERKRIEYDYVRLSPPALVSAFQDCDRAMFTAAGEEGALVLDVARPITGHSKFFVDHIHTRPAGSRAIARALADFLDPVLTEADKAGTARLGTGEPIHG